MGTMDGGYYEQVLVCVGDCWVNEANKFTFL